MEVPKAAAGGNNSEVPMKTQHHFQFVLGRWLLHACVFALVLASPARAAEHAARVQFVFGQVDAIADAGERRRLQRGDDVFVGESIESAAASAAQLVFSDSSRMALRANTIVRIENYRYDADDRANSNSLIALLRGAVRSITGLIGKHNRRNVTLVTPVATIGIRGTDYEVIHVPASASPGLAGTYNKVYSGATTLQSARGALPLERGQIGFVAGSPGSAAAPVRIDALPEAVADTIAHALPDAGEIEPADGDPVLQFIDDTLATNSLELDLNSADLEDGLDSTTGSVMNSLDGGLGDTSGGTGEPLSGSGSLSVPLDTNQLNLPRL